METRGLTIKRTETGDEPVTLEQLKAHLSIDFNDHDDLLNILLSAARKTVEKYIGLTLVESEITVRWEVLTTRELPYGPVKSLTSVQDKDDTDIASHTMEGMVDSFMTIVANSETPVIVKYVSGMDPVPEDLRLAIMKLASDNFENSPEVEWTNTKPGLLPSNWKETCKPHSRKTWIG